MGDCIHCCGYVAIAWYPPRMRVLRQILSDAKSFDDTVIGNIYCNLLGLHVARIAASDVALKIRRAQTTWPTSDVRSRLKRDGVVIWPNFLSDADFAALKEEAHKKMEKSERELPLPRPDNKGYGKHRPIKGGFDHFDGGTLNRYLTIDHKALPKCNALVNHPELKKLATYASGLKFPADRCRLYMTVHTNDPSFPDIQAVNHKDSFHSTIKFWFYIDDCPLENGPFAYSVGSHRMTRARYRWEYDRSVRACALKQKEGSFRVTDDEVAKMGFPPLTPFPLKGNTLVVADTRGFHKRTNGKPGARRLSIFANMSRMPFKVGVE